MSARRPMSVVVVGLKTKSAKIKALIAEGYLRADVARYLEINYQHVRKVLEDAGIRAGLQNAGGPSAKPTPEPKARPPMSVRLLLDAGFIRLGTWTSVEGKIALETPAPKTPGVYAFVIDGPVMYVGVTHASFHQRMGNYRLGHSGQKTSSRINLTLIDELATGRTVEIYLATPEPSIWHGLPVNTAAGLEEGLIQQFTPPWNVRGVKAG